MASTASAEVVIRFCRAIIQMAGCVTSVITSDELFRTTYRTPSKQSVGGNGQAPNDIAVTGKIGKPEYCSEGFVLQKLQTPKGIILQAMSLILLFLTNAPLPSSPSNIIQDNSTSLWPLGSIPP